MLERNPRLSLQSCEQRFQLAMVLGGCSIQRRHLRVELKIDSLVVNFVGALEVRSVAACGVPVTGALRVATLHHSLEHGSFTEVIELHDLLFEGLEALRILSNEGGQFLV